MSKKLLDFLPCPNPECAENVRIIPTTAYTNCYFCGTPTQNPHIHKVNMAHTDLGEDDPAPILGADPVAEAPHWTQFDPQPIELCEQLPFLEGNIIKYVARHDAKNGIEDLRKAEFLLKRLIERASDE